MKRIILFLIVLSSMLYANPIDGSPTINEIQIIEPDNWFIEIMASYGSIVNIDSIFIESLSGKAKVECLDSTSVYPFFTQENLSNDLQFSRTCDSITIHIYGYTYNAYYSRSLVIGDFSGSYLHNIDSSQSLIYDMYNSEYYKCKTPTPGEENGGIYYGTIYGHFYDKDGTPISNRFVNIRNGQFLTVSSDTIDANGNYSSILSSHYHAFDEFYIWRWNNSSIIGDNWNFSRVEFDLEPGDSMEVDFYATQTSIRPVIQNTIKFNNYPHPASSYTWFFIDNTEVEASAMRVNVYALNGRKMDSFIPTAKQFRYDCAHLPQGSYVMSLQHGNELLATKKLQILK